MIADPPRTAIAPALATASRRQSPAAAPGRCSEACPAFNPLREGIDLRCTDQHVERDTASSDALTGPSIRILLQLEGDPQLQVGQTRLPLDAGQGADALAKGAVVLVGGAQQLSLDGRAPAGSHQRRVSITLYPAWFDTVGIPRAVFAQALRLHPWTPSARALEIAAQLSEAPPAETGLARLHQDSRTLELVLEALAQALGAHAEHADDSPRPSTHPASVRRLQTLLDSGAADGLDMARIARHIGAEPNTLSRQFHAAHGQSVFDYLRERRLERAAGALRCQGVSLERAAQIAGFGTPASFSTAFQRQFGVAPSQFGTCC